MESPWIINPDQRNPTQKYFPEAYSTPDDSGCSRSMSTMLNHPLQLKPRSSGTGIINYRRSRPRISISTIRDKFRNHRTKNVFILFCSTTSMRGMNKISRGPKPMRILWMFFVSIMSIVLIVSSCLLVRDFMLYDVNIITDVLRNSLNAFPSITVCHHHPFSVQAYKLWRERKIMSPSWFNRRMRNLTHQYLLNNQIEDAERLTNYEGISVYYQNLNYEEAISVGHQKDIFLSCNQLAANTLAYQDDCFKLDNYTVHRFSHHEHFNCYTFEATSLEVENLGIIVSMGPKPDYGNTEQAFIVDTFKQAKGLKVLVHEPGTLPDIDSGGMHVEPGKMNDISYRPSNWTLEHTPNKPCFGQNNMRKVYKDLNLQYDYTHKMCIETIKQQKIIDRCRCMFIYYPRLQIPSDDVPYCGKILRPFNWEKTKQQIDCIVKVFSETDSDNLRKEQCPQRCNYIKYETSISITKWRATEWHLHWIRLQLLTFRNMKNYLRSHKNESITKSKDYQQWLEYYNAKNLSAIKNDKNEHFLSEENYAYIVLRRESTDSERKYERLVITPYVLVSRIGGLCSLTVGITTSFFVEMIEFIYLYHKSKKEEKHQEKERRLANKSSTKSISCSSGYSGIGKNTDNFDDADDAELSDTEINAERGQISEINKPPKTGKKIKINLSNNVCIDGPEILL